MRCHVSGICFVEVAEGLQASLAFGSAALDSRLQQHWKIMQAKQANTNNSQSMTFRYANS